ncbi:DUF881 domain-containing protein [Clostridium sp. 19966]|uniref:DUF881 domain-containing protein n=1 Tax=Clostridium sp. 19966 TaxID=2768166 RepID=UPI0028DE44B1|nr:DUF881 domain-containing protein [Clostridium sp. 19966]MDT8715894.1 DUF881 domain-containing protein [Clostridium sp. 19966]
MKKINLLDEADKKYSNASTNNYEINGCTLDKNRKMALNNLSRLVPIVAGAVQILLVISLLLFAPYIAAKIYSHNLPFSNTQTKVNQLKLKSYSLTIMLNDNYSNDNEASQIRDHVVTIKDINSVIRIFKSAGSDNIFVNDIRLSKDTEAVVYGQFVQIENKKLIAPYIIRSSGILSNSVDRVINDKTINELILRGVVEKVEKQEDDK